MNRNQQFADLCRVPFTHGLNSFIFFSDLLSYLFSKEKTNSPSLKLVEEKQPDFLITLR